MSKPFFSNFMPSRYCIAVTYVLPSGLKVVATYAVITTACIVLVTVAERLVRCVAVCSIYVEQSIFRIHDLIYPCANFLVQLVVKVKGVNLNGLPNIIRHRGVTLREFLH